MTLIAGLHYNISSADYFADPCPEPSLTQSIAKLILRSPAHARQAHPRLNPDQPERDGRKYDVGNIAHRLLLGRGRELEIIPGYDWVADRKAKSELREDALSRGKLAVLSRDYETGHAMTEAAFKALIMDRPYAQDWDTDDVDPPRAEVVAITDMAWQHTDRPHHLIWLRCMIDWLPSLTRIWDYKTTSASASPDAVSRFLPDWCIQAAMHERILNLIDPDNAGRREHRFVVQENYEPYALTVVRLTETHMTMGRAQIARAEATWARCMATNEWPAYPLEDASPEFPGWAVRSVTDVAD